MGYFLHGLLNPEYPPGPPYVHMLVSDPIYWQARFPVTPKLCIDGREYHRRQKRRTKGRRKR